jgi:hypothetical protein
MVTAKNRQIYGHLGFVRVSMYPVLVLVRHNFKSKLSELLDKGRYFHFPAYSGRIK